MGNKKVFGVAKKIDKKTLQQMKRAGMTEFEIAAKFGCNRSHITRATIHFGLQGLGAQRGHGTIKLKPIDKRDLAILRNRGWKLHEIAKHFGCGVNHVSVLIRKYDLPKSKAGRPNQS